MQRCACALAQRPRAVALTACTNAHTTQQHKHRKHELLARHLIQHDLLWCKVSIGRQREGSCSSRRSGAQQQEQHQGLQKQGAASGGRHWLTTLAPLPKPHILEAEA
jgi:hypothetical protein